VTGHHRTLRQHNKVQHSKTGRDAIDHGKTVLVRKSPGRVIEVTLHPAIAVPVIVIAREVVMIGGMTDEETTGEMTDAATDGVMVMVAGRTASVVPSRSIFRRSRKKRSPRFPTA